MLVLAVPPLIPPEPKPVLRPPQELHCIYDGASPAVRDAAALHMWTQDRNATAIVELLSDAQNACRHRNNWSDRDLVIAFNYAQHFMLLHYARARLSALHVDTSRLDRAYRTSPAEERTRLESRTGSRSMVAEFLGNPAAYAGDPEIAAHSGIYLSALIGVERAERMWAGQLPYSLF